MDDIFIINHLNGKAFKMFLPWHEHDYLQQLLVASRAPYELEMLVDIFSRMSKCGRMNNTGVFIDVGANIGNHSLFIACLGGNVLAFEPNKDLLPIFEKNININFLGKKITIYPFALGDEQGKADFLEANISNRGAQSLSLGCGEIDVMSYDSLNINKKISVIKIDTEGMEYDVLRGMKQSIRLFHPAIYFECDSFDRLISIYSFMYDNGYFYWDTFNATPTHLFIHESSISDKLSMKKRLTYFLRHLRTSSVPCNRYGCNQK